MTGPFSSISGVQYGCHQLLSTLHRDAMKQFYTAPKEEREQYAERAAQYRDMMDRLNLVRMVSYATR